MFLTTLVARPALLLAIGAMSLPALAQSSGGGGAAVAPEPPQPAVAPPAPGAAIYRLQPTTRPGDGLFSLQLQQAQIEQQTELQTYLGVSTRSLPREVAPHVNVAEGVGLLVSFVEPESPATEAGIEKDDIIVKFNDQWAINMDQFAVLVRMHEKGEAVTLTLLRRGEQQEVEVTLAEKMLPVGGQHPFGSGNFTWHASTAPMAPGARGGSTFVMPPQPPTVDVEALQKSLARRAAEALKAEQRALLEAHRLELELMRPELLVPDADTRGARVTITNGNLSARLVNENGQSTLTIEDKDSDFQYEGPFPSEEEIKEMPEDVQNLVRQVKRYTVSSQTPEPRPAPDTRPAERERDEVRA